MRQFNPSLPVSARAREADRAQLVSTSALLHHLIAYPRAIGSPHFDAIPARKIIANLFHSPFSVSMTCAHSSRPDHRSDQELK
ncbi:unnamed protein product, partial [Protopolystoma xenopodis]